MEGQRFCHAADLLKLVCSARLWSSESRRRSVAGGNCCFPRVANRISGADTKDDAVVVDACQRGCVGHFGERVDPDGSGTEQLDEWDERRFDRAWGFGRFIFRAHPQCGCASEAGVSPLRCKACEFLRDDRFGGHNSHDRSDYVALTVLQKRLVFVNWPMADNVGTSAPKRFGQSTSASPFARRARRERHAMWEFELAAPRKIARGQVHGLSECCGLRLRDQRARAAGRGQRDRDAAGNERDQNDRQGGDPLHREIIPREFPMGLVC